MALPTHIYIGYDKSGSTWLFNALSSNPYVSLAQSKETFFFDRFFHNGLDWYSSFFSDSSQVRLDISHDYIFYKESIDRILSTMPNVNIIIFLRNPIFKLWSMYNYAKRTNRISCSLRSAIKNDPGMVRRSLYYDDINYILNNFSNVKIFYFDELESDPVIFYQSICCYLNIPSISNTSLDKKVNQAAIFRFPFLNFLVNNLSKLLRFSKLYSVIGFLKTNHFLQRLFFKPSNATLSKADFKYLLSLFNDDIDSLSKLLSRDFTSWKKYL